MICRCAMTDKEKQQIAMAYPEHILLLIHMHRDEIIDTDPEYWHYLLLRQLSIYNAMGDKEFYKFRRRLGI